MARLQIQNVNAGVLNNSLIQSLECNSESLSGDYIAFKATTEAYVNHCTNVIEWWNPPALAAKVSASNITRWHEPMNHPDKAGYLEAMRVKITTLT